MGFLLGFLYLLLLMSGLAFLQTAVPVSAQSANLLLEEAACREDPHSEHCICAKVRKFGYFPKEFEERGGRMEAKDVDGDGKAPEFLEEDGVWVDENGEADAGEDTDLQFMVDDRYAQRCSLSYFRENQRRLWHFGVALGAVFTVISLTWVGVVHMQNTASGEDLSRTRGMLVRVLVGVVILACSFLVWEGLNAFLFEGVESWTLERGVFYDLR